MEDENLIDNNLQDFDQRLTPDQQNLIENKDELRFD